MSASPTTTTFRFARPGEEIPAIILLVIVLSGLTWLVTNNNPASIAVAVVSLLGLLRMASRRRTKSSVKVTVTNVEITIRSQGSVGDHDIAVSDIESVYVRQESYRDVLVFRGKDAGLGELPVEVLDSSADLRDALSDVLGDRISGRAAAVFQ